MDIKKINEGHLTRISLSASRMLSIYGSILLDNTVVELRSAALGFDSRVDLHDKICRSIRRRREFYGLYDIDSPDYKVYSELIILFDKWREDVEAFYRTPAEVSLDASVGKYKYSEESIHDCWINRVRKESIVLLDGFSSKIKQFTLDLLNEWDEDIDPGDVGSDDVGSLCYRFNTAVEVMEYGTADWMCVFTIGSMFNKWNEDLLEFHRDSRETPVNPVQSITPAGNVRKEPSALDLLNERSISKGYDSWLSLMKYWTIVSNDDSRTSAANDVNDIALSVITDLLSKAK